MVQLSELCKIPSTTEIALFINGIEKSYISHSHTYRHLLPTPYALKHDSFLISTDANRQGLVSLSVLLLVLSVILSHQIIISFNSHISTY